WDNRTAVVIPDEDIFYPVAFLSSAVPSSTGTDGLEHILKQNNFRFLLQKHSSFDFANIGKWKSLRSVISGLETREIEQFTLGLQNRNSDDIKGPSEVMISFNNEKDLKENLNSASLNVDEVEGLPCPPIDEDFLLMGLQPEMDLNEFFNGIDDDGNICDINESAESPGSVLKPKLQEPRRGKEFNLLKSLYLQNDKVAEKVEVRKVSTTMKLKKRPHSAVDDLASTEATQMIAPVKRSRCQDGDNLTNTGLATAAGNRVCRDSNDICQKKVQVDTIMGQKQKIDLRKLDEVSKKLKLKASVKKLYESYNAKKGRQIQVIDFRDLPKSTNCSIGHHQKEKKFTWPSVH
ncbi:Cytokinin dehydrogenase 1, FAD/cytokinin binding domain, partial [Dillenia turbinata]